MADWERFDVGKKTSVTLDSLSKIEALGEEILTDKQQLVDLNRKKNGNREAINSMKRKEGDSNKSWLCMGSTFFRLEDAAIKGTLENDQKELDLEIESIRNGLTEKVSQLHQLEGQKDNRGFSLASLSAEDLAFVKGDALQ